MNTEVFQSSATILVSSTVRGKATASTVSSCCTTGHPLMNVMEDRVRLAIRHVAFTSIAAETGLCGRWSKAAFHEHEPLSCKSSQIKIFALTCERRHVLMVVLRTGAEALGPSGFLQ